MKPEQTIEILESRVESLTGANNKLHDMIANQIALIHELQLKLAAYEQ